MDGKTLGIAFTNVDVRELYPTISMHGPNEEVEINIGHKPFFFDLQAIILVC